MHTKALKLICQADLDRRLKQVMYDVEHLEIEASGAFKRILSTDRMILYQAMGRVLNVSDCDNLQNRDELSFFESLCHLFNYYIYDDGDLTIKWERYNLHDGKFVPCKKTAKNARPYLDYAHGDEDDVHVGEKEIMWIIYWYFRKKEWNIKEYKAQGIYDGSMDKQNYIDYFN